MPLQQRCCGACLRVRGTIVLREIRDSHDMRVMQVHWPVGMQRGQKEQRRRKKKKKGVCCQREERWVYHRGSPEGERDSVLLEGVWYGGC